MSEQLTHVQNEVQRLAGIAIGPDEDRAVEAARQLHDFYIPQLPWPLDLQTARAIHDHAVLSEVQAIAGEDVGLAILMAIGVNNEFDASLASEGEGASFDEVATEFARKPKIDLEDIKDISHFAITPNKAISLKATELMSQRIGELPNERDILGAVMAVGSILENQGNDEALVIINRIHNQTVDKLSPPRDEFVLFNTK